MVLDKNRPSSETLIRSIKSPRVSIGMPVYNGEKLIRRALDSLLEQTFTDFELIISDNMSTDNTQQICLEYSSHDERIRYHRTDMQIKAIANFNRVLSYARGEYFMWAAHDDRWAPSFIESMIQALDANPRAVLSFSRFCNLDDTGNLTPAFKENWANVFSRSKFWQFVAMTLSDELITQKANHIYGLIRRNVLIEYGGMISLPNMDYSGEDILTLLRLLIKWEFVIVNEVLFHYRARSHTKRHDEPLTRYLWQRFARQKSGHQGNLVLFFIRNHAYHAKMRKIIFQETLLPIFAKLVLWLALLIKEIWFPIRFLPHGILRELRVLRD